MNTLIGANVLLGLGGGVHTCYGLLAGEICPNRYKFLGVAICVIPAILPTGFGAYQVTWCIMRTGAIIMAMRTAIRSIFATMFVAILDNKLMAKLASMIPPAAIAAGLPESSLTALFATITAGTASTYAKVSGITPAIEGALTQTLSNTYSAAYAYVYYAAMAVGGVGLIATIVMRNYDDELNTHVPRKVYAGGREDDSSSESKIEDLVVDVAELEKSAGK